MLSAALLLVLLGLLLSVATTFMWFRLARLVAIPNNRTAFLLGWVSAGALGVASFMSAGAGVLSGLLGGLAILGSTFLLGLYTLGKQGVGNPISVGDTAPQFEAIDDQGNTFSSASLTGTPTLVKFFRGHW
jgi:hypothetical protein